MKKILYGVLILVLSVGLFVLDSSDILAKEMSDANSILEEENIITVNGTGTLKVKPDIAYINVGIEIFSEDAQKAQAQNREIMDKVITEIKKVGIKDEDIKTVVYDIYRTTRYEPKKFDGKYDKEARTEGYNVRNIVEVRIRDIESVGKIIDAASSSGANIINSIKFGVEDEEKYYNDALKLAMKNAFGKAETIGESFGGKISKPYSVVENGYRSPVIYRDAIKYSAAVGEALQIPVEVGELEITARVIAKYKYK
ncbi:MAG: uncharacterized protein PWQ37_736 [Candidatus Petromonas sp.]|jgi:uncharacterized protein YggE|nr:uncharacterized protein [Candidatus Petromonas sp.]